MLFKVTKTYGHNLGLSACFRQWRANSHCRFLHGYSLQITLGFAAPALNQNNWVIDFGSLKPVKKWLEDTFDHKTLVAVDDPLLPWFRALSLEPGLDSPIAVPPSALLDIIEVPATGCEAFALMVKTYVDTWLEQTRSQLHGGDNGVFLDYVEVREHGANSATVTR